MRGPLSGMFPVHLPVPSFADALAPLSDKLPKVEPSKGQLAKMAWKKAGSIQAQFPSLSRDECAAVVLYTMEDMPRERSPYYVMKKNRQAVRPWRDFVWLLLRALRKLPPSKARVVYRGMAGSVLEEGDELQWSAFSSTATKVDVMEVFLATSGQRTMIHLELTEPVGRDVSAFSLYPQECEVLLPPNICFEVVSRYKAGSGLVMVQCRQTESLDALLGFGRRGDVPLGQPIDEVPMGVPADDDGELQAKMARLQVAREKAVKEQLQVAREKAEKEAQRERDASRLIELGAETRERALALLERYGSLQAAANAFCAAADTSIPSEVRKWVEQLRSGGDRQKEEAAVALRKLAWNSKYAVPITKAGGIAPLVALARGGMSRKQELATVALWVLSYNKTNLAAMKDLGYGMKSFFGGWTVPHPEG